MVTLKEDINAIGARVLVRCKVNGEDFQWHEFNVHSITGQDNEPVLHMEVEYHDFDVDSFLTLPLKSFDQRVFSVAPEDQFWTVQNAVKA